MDMNFCRTYSDKASCFGIMDGKDKTRRPIEERNTDDLVDCFNKDIGTLYTDWRWTHFVQYAMGTNGL